ncbi:MAG: patatin-like phospholipase family protein, partial [Bacillota bacterium]|nr:patatin-like phospholipase family protein [Bacillota bacterium]
PVVVACHERGSGGRGRSGVIGVALGGGAARGLAHIGILKVLDREGIPVSSLAGSSIGSLIAAAYACGTLPELESRLRRLRRSDLVQYADLQFAGGVFKGEALRDEIRRLTRDMDFRDLEGEGPALVIVAADLRTGRPVLLKEGKIAEAVRASISVPGLFAPVPRGDLLLVDGGLVDLVPVDALTALNPLLTVGVDVFSSSDLWTRAATTARVSVRTAMRTWRRIRRFAENGLLDRVRYAEEMAERIFVERYGPLFRGAFASLFAHLIADPSREAGGCAGEEANGSTGSGRGGEAGADGWGLVRAVLAAFEITETLLQSRSPAVQADVVIRPPVGKFHGHQFYLAAELIEAGELSCQEVIPFLRAALSHRLLY